MRKKEETESHHPAVWIGMSRIALAAALSAAFLAVLADAKAETAGFSPIDVALVSDQSGIVPGQIFTVALHQKIAPGFHTYWKNPGTVGLPTSIRWQLPPGFKAGPIQWPLPKAQRMTVYRVWGYQNEALLLADIAAPPDLPLGKTVRIVAEASWMCCGRQCHPGFKKLELLLPSTKFASQNTAWAGKFEQVRNQQPKAFPDWKIQCVRTENQYKLSAVSPHFRAAADNADSKSGAAAKPPTIRFFGFRRQISSDKPQIVRPLPNGYELTLFAEEFGAEEQSRLTGILVSSRGWRADCPQRPLLIDVPIEFQSAAGKTLLCPRIRDEKNARLHKLNR